MDARWCIEQILDGGSVDDPLGTRNGKKCIALFSSEEKCQEFIRSYEEQQRHFRGTMLIDESLATYLARCRSQSIAYYVLDPPSSQDDTGRLVDIYAWLRESDNQNPNPEAAAIVEP